MSTPREPQDLQTQVWYQRPRTLVPDPQWTTNAQYNLNKINNLARSAEGECLIFAMSVPHGYIETRLYSGDYSSSIDIMNRIGWGDLLCSELRDSVWAHGLFEPNNNPRVSGFDVLNWENLDPAFVQEVSSVIRDVIFDGNNLGLPDYLQFRRIFQILWFQHGRYTGLSERAYFQLIINIYERYDLRSLLSYVREQAVENHNCEAGYYRKFPDMVRMRKKVLNKLIRDFLNARGAPRRPRFTTTISYLAAEEVGLLSQIKLHVNSVGNIYPELTRDDNNNDWVLV